MELFSSQIQFLEDLEKSIYPTLKQVLSIYGYEVEDYITEKQLYEKGIDGTGNPIRNKQTGRLGYTRTTIRIKKAKGQPADRITLRDEEKFHPSITINAYADRMEITSNVTYSKYLVKRYGKEIVMPTKDNMIYFFDNYFLPELKSNVNDKLTR